MHVETYSAQFVVYKVLRRSHACATMEPTFLFLLVILRIGGHCAIDWHEKLQSELKLPSDISIPSRITVNYLSKYFSKSDRFVQIQMTSKDIIQSRLQSTLIDTIVRDKKLMNFTFQLATHESNKPILSNRNFSTHFRRSPFFLFVIDSIKDFP